MAKKTEVLMTHREQRLEELNKLRDPNFKLPEGLYIPLGQEIIVKEIKQGQWKTKAGLIIPDSDRLVQAKLGIVYNFGEDINLPLAAGMTIAFDRMCNFAVAHEGEAYIVLQSVFVKAILPPGNYLPVHVPDNIELRRKSRRESQKIAHKIMDQKLDEIQNG